MISVDLSTRLKDLRQTKSVDQETVANMLEVSRSTYTKYETGQNKPSHDALIKLANYFSVSTDYLLGQTADPRSIDDINKANQERISRALAGEPAELLDFWEELKQRDDLFLLFKQARELDDDSIRRIIRIIKAIEDEEEAGHRYE